ncbi:transposase [Portibacter lacus]|uniref:Transposase InsH N-terminal domain-containing protein n=1 Tax=Portibacter lacus TaxID=1099794 RepID=A0AA37SUL0_9BACT|nr:transposase [Portibacter lacus]GLR18245.1 hypothetical protein GCM10007940_28610 [Portibacter lacus]
MNFNEGIDRNQISFTSIDMLVDQNSWARHIDIFVDSLPLDQLGFKTTTSSQGRPPFHPADLLKLYLYGYRHGIRSSRKLEHCCIVNMEMMWLLKGLRPCNRTIAYFRKNNPLAIKNTFRYFVLLLKELGYVEGTVIALDSVKIRAQNSLKNNFNSKKIKRHKDYIDERIEDYLQQLEETDNEEAKQEIENKIAERKVKKAHYEQIERELEQSGEAQISLVDPDAKAVILHRNIVNVGYNVQMVSDEKNKMIIHADAGSVNDTCIFLHL